MVLDGVPDLGPELVDETRRFMTLVDALYEHRTLLVMAAASPLDALHRDGPIEFEFERTRSRLVEMQSNVYRHAHHLA